MPAWGDSVPATKAGCIWLFGGAVGQVPPFSAALVSKVALGSAAGPDSGAEKGVSTVGSVLVVAAGGGTAEGAAGAPEDIQFQFFERELGVFEKLGGDLSGLGVGFKTTRELDLYALAFERDIAGEQGAVGVLVGGGQVEEAGQWFVQQLGLDFG